MTHGTVSGYTNGKCRCHGCREAMLESQRARRAKRKADADDDDREAMRNLLIELFPFGLTDDCPARAGR